MWFHNTIHNVTPIRNAYNETIKNAFSEYYDLLYLKNFDFITAGRVKAKLTSMRDFLERASDELYAVFVRYL